MRRLPSASSPVSTASSLPSVRRDIIACKACPRLRAYCERVGREKRAAFRNETYWAKPVPGFGDPKARIVLVGLAPAAHGANRTGRNFTGDGVGGSGDFLMAALHANGLANQPISRVRDDGLELLDTWIMAAVRCAPPQNKPTPAEIARCHPHLRAELDALPNVRVIVGLGKIAFDACWRMLGEWRGRLDDGRPVPKRPLFAHGAVHREPGLPALVGSYHPSRQNTHTGRLTPTMLTSALGKARALARQAQGERRTADR